MKYGKPQDFLILVKDNIESAVCTSGKYMVYGRGELAQDFFGGKLKYNEENFYVHKNHHNFEEDKTVAEKPKKNVDISQEEQEKEAEIVEAPTNVTNAKEKKKVAEKPLTKYDIHLIMATKPGAEGEVQGEQPHLLKLGELGS